MTYRVEFRQFEGEWRTVKEGLTLDAAITEYDPYLGMSQDEAQRTTLLMQIRIVDETGKVAMEWGRGEDNREEIVEVYDHLNKLLNTAQE